MDSLSWRMLVIGQGPGRMHLGKLDGSKKNGTVWCCFDCCLTILEGRKMSRGIL